MLAQRPPFRTLLDGLGEKKIMANQMDMASQMASVLLKNVRTGGSVE